MIWAAPARHNSGPPQLSSHEASPLMLLPSVPGVRTALQSSNVGETERLAYKRSHNSVLWFASHRTHQCRCAIRKTPVIVCGVCRPAWEADHRPRPRHTCAILHAPPPHVLIYYHFLCIMPALKGAAFTAFNCCRCLMRSSYPGFLQPPRIVRLLHQERPP